MKLIIQIPCFNEEKTLDLTLRDLPKNIDGISSIETLVIDDGSTDNTIETARKNGVDHIVSFRKNKGLARAFMAGLDASLKLGADIIVNTDADNQYSGKDIAKLVRPILDGEADIVVGERDIDNIEHFSFLKKKLQRIGSWVVRQVSGTEVPDTTSGFRAYSKEAALHLNVISNYTYTLETVIQAGKKNFAIMHTPVETNEKTRESRLISSLPSYLKKSAATILRIYAMYEPLKVFLTAGIIFFGLGTGLGIRFLYFYFFHDHSGHIQSLILSSILLIIGFTIMVVGLLADLISANRRLIEDALYRLKKIELKIPK